MGSLVTGGTRCASYFSSGRVCGTTFSHRVHPTRSNLSSHATELENAGSSATCRTGVDVAATELENAGFSVTCRTGVDVAATELENAGSSVTHRTRVAVAASLERKDHLG
eukprot:scaffold7477_cov72-Skeletonema_dohrnii-CCMP3373.AAC.1